jgi:hypothetical protein
MLMQVLHVLTADFKGLKHILLLYKDLNGIELDKDERQRVTGTNDRTQMDFLPVAITIVCGKERCRVVGTH